MARQPTGRRSPVGLRRRQRSVKLAPSLDLVVEYLAERDHGANFSAALDVVVAAGLDALAAQGQDVPLPGGDGSHSRVVAQATPTAKDA